MLIESIEKADELEYFTTLTDHEGKVHHFFRPNCPHDDIHSLALDKARELNGTYLISANYSNTAIHVIITCNNDDWKSKISKPIMTTTLRRANA